MERMLLSLKNLYKILMTNDFPIYSESVISKKNRKGQTVLRFWQNQLTDALRGMPTGKMLWRSDGKRNRYVSNLCNRALEQKLCAQYALELSAGITPAVLLNQIQRFMSFLSGKAYRHDVLLRRCEELLRLCALEDGDLPERVLEHLRGVTAECGEDSRDKLFQAGYLLTMLTIYAAAGDAMGEPSLAVLREEECSLGALWESYREKRSAPGEEVRYLSLHTGILQDNPLPAHRFFGREEALYDLREMAATGRKSLISGMGGVGKTELLRQLLRLCVEEGTVDAIVAVPYEGSLVESFLRAFPDYRRPNAQEGFEAILRMLERQASEGARLLTLVDNMNNAPEEDPELGRLLTLPGCVLITSRRTALTGFESYDVGEISAATGSLIFRDNYGKPLSREDREALKQLLRGGGMCHPLTLRLMARAAGENGWPVRYLAEQLRDGLADLTWTEERQAMSLDRVYRRLYSQTMLSQSCREVAELLTLLPRDSYTPAFLAGFFPHSAQTLGEKLALLEAEGWLEEDDGGYSMHPLIVQCLRKKVLPEERLASVLTTLRKSLSPAVWSGGVGAGEGDAVSDRCLIHISRLITGTVSRELLLDVLTAMRNQIIPRTTQEACAVYLEGLLRRCPRRDDTVTLRWYTLLGEWKLAGDAPIEAVFRAQLEKLTVETGVFFDFCLSAASDRILRREYALAEEMLEAVLHADAGAERKAGAYYHLIGLNHCAGNAEEALRRAQEGVAYTGSHPQCGNGIRFLNTSMLCMSYLKFNREAECRRTLAELDSLISDQSTPAQRIEYLSCKSTCEQVFGDIEKAAEYVEQELALTLEYGGKDRNYYATLGRSASIYNRLKRREEAEPRYLEVVEHARQVNDRAALQMAANNVSVFYLVGGEPEKALTYLELALEVGRETGGLMLGESLKNQAKAWEMLGDTEREYAGLSEAVPLLNAAYGAEHPRAKPSALRLETLRALRTSPEVGT